MNRLEKLITETLYLERKSDQENIKKSVYTYKNLLMLSRRGELEEYMDIYLDNSGDVDKEYFKISLNFVGYELDLFVEFNQQNEDYVASFSTYFDDEEEKYALYFNLKAYDEQLANQILKLNWESDQFVEIISKNINKIIPRVEFIHEFTHFLDYISQPEDVWKSDQEKTLTPNYAGSSDYYNDFKEIQARMMEGFVEYRNDLKRGKYTSFNKFYESFIDYIFESDEKDGAWNKISEENKKRIKKRLYSYWSENR